MTRFLLIFVLSGALAFSISPQKGARIFGGENAVLGDFPYMVSLREEGGHFCGGSIINANTILTAAHCVSERTPEVITVVTGSVTLNNGGDSFQVDRIINHEQWDSNTILNDIALLKLTTNITFNDNVAIISLESDEVSDNTDGVICGFGVTTPGGDNSNELKYLRTTVVNYQECKGHQPDDDVPAIVESHICSLDTVGYGTCNQDSGGPLAVNNKQVGIVSWGVACGESYGDVYTKVSFYYDWIEINA